MLLFPLAISTCVHTDAKNLYTTLISFRSKYLLQVGLHDLIHSQVTCISFPDVRFEMYEDWNLIPCQLVNGYLCIIGENVK